VRVIRVVAAALYDEQGRVLIADRPLRTSARQPVTARPAVGEGEAARIVEQVIEDKLDRSSRFHGERRVHEALARHPKTAPRIRIARHKSAAFVDRQAFSDPETVDADIAQGPDRLACPSRAERLRGVLDDGDVGRYGAHEIPDTLDVGQRAAVVGRDDAERVGPDQRR